MSEVIVVETHCKTCTCSQAESQPVAKRGVATKFTSHRLPPLERVKQRVLEILSEDPTQQLTKRVINKKIFSSGRSQLNAALDELVEEELIEQISIGGPGTGKRSGTAYKIVA